MVTFSARPIRTGPLPMIVTVQAAAIFNSRRHWRELSSASSGVMKVSVELRK